MGQEKISTIPLRNSLLSHYEFPPNFSCCNSHQRYNRQDRPYQNSPYYNFPLDFFLLHSSSEPCRNSLLSHYEFRAEFFTAVLINDIIINTALATTFSPLYFLTAIPPGVLLSTQPLISSHTYFFSTNALPDAFRNPLRIY